MKHELSHAMYIVGDDLVQFTGNGKWVYEGWANVMGEIMDNQIDGAARSFRLYYESYLDKDTIKGTIESTIKQNTTHSVEYSFATSTQLTLLSAASQSNNNLDFYKKINGAIYDYLKSRNQLFLSFDEYKNIIKPYLTGVKVDGKDAFDWYVNTPVFYSQGSLGPHIGVLLLNSETDLAPVKIQAFAFRRVKEGKEVKEYPIRKLEMKIAMKDSQNRVVLNKDIVSDENGDSEIELRDNPAILLKTGTYGLTIGTTVDNKIVENKMFAFVPPKMRVRGEYLYGVLLDEDQNMLNGNYIALVLADSKFLYKKNGLFIIEIPKERRTVDLNFLGFKQEVTKGPFTRVYAMTIPASYVEQAKMKTESELWSGFVDKTEAMTIINNPRQPFEGRAPKVSGIWENLWNRIRDLFGSRVKNR